MSKKPKVRAAGAVALRGRGDKQEVLLIHRAKHSDWSFPKGKGETDELAPQTAVREVLEETGVLVQLGLRLPTLRYNVSRGAKAVKYWRASVVDEAAAPADDEADQVKWMRVSKAMDRLTYADERQLLKTAVEAPETTVLMVVRHAKAMLRKNWSGADQERRLTGRGRRQAKELRHLLRAYGIAELISSSSTRCVDTLQPYAKASSLPLQTADVLTEEEGVYRPKDVRQFVSGVMENLSAPTAICGHRPVLPAMFAGLGLEPRSMLVAEAIVIHRDAQGNYIAVEDHKPTS